METQLDSLQRLVQERLSPEENNPKQGWQAIVGTFADDPTYDEAMRLGQEWRESEWDHSVADTPNSRIHRL